MFLRAKWRGDKDMSRDGCGRYNQHRICVSIKQPERSDLYLTPYSLIPNT